MARLLDPLDVLVVGAGQAALALGYHLRSTPLRFQLVDRHPRLGDSWRKRYDSLVLFTPRDYSALPGLPVPGDPQGYPTNDESPTTWRRTQPTSIYQPGWNRDHQTRAT